MPLDMKVGNTLSTSNTRESTQRSYNLFEKQNCQHVKQKWTYEHFHMDKIILY